MIPHRSAFIVKHSGTISTRARLEVKSGTGSVIPYDSWPMDRRLAQGPCSYIVVVRRSRYQPASSKWDSRTKADCHPGWEKACDWAVGQVYPVRALHEAQTLPRWCLCMEGVMYIHTYISIKKSQVGESMRIFDLLRLIPMSMYAISRQIQCVGVSKFQLWTELTGST